MKTRPSRRRASAALESAEPCCRYQASIAAEPLASFLRRSDLGVGMGRHLTSSSGADAYEELRTSQPFFESLSKAQAAWGRIVRAAKRFVSHEDAVSLIKVKEPSASYKRTATAILSLLPIQKEDRNRAQRGYSIEREGAAGEVLASTCAIAINTDDAPEWIELIPAGKFSAVDGRGPFENDDPDSIVAASIAKMPQVGLVLDYDHSTDLAAPEGRPAPAAGWLKQFKVERGAIFARIEWTADAAEAVKEKKYRYVSPVFEHSEDGKVERILRAALTNNPALIDLPALAAARMAMAVYAYVDSDGGGHLPIGDAAHVRNALSRFDQTFFESRAKAQTAWSHIRAAAKEFGIDMTDKMPTPKIKEPSSGYKKGSSLMANEEGIKLSEVMAVLEKAYPDAQPQRLMKAAACLMGQDEPDGDEDEPEEDAAADPYDNETGEQMAARQAEEMAKCASDGERAETAKKHEEQKARFAKRFAVKPMSASVIDKPRQRRAGESLDNAVARHPMVLGMAREISALRSDRAKDAATQKVDSAIRDGRLIPSQREWAISYCTADTAGFDKFIGAQPKILYQGADGTFNGRIGEPPQGAHQFSHEQLEILSNLGLESDEQVAKCAAVQRKWDLRFPRPRLMLDDGAGVKEGEAK
jgi:phage I-like protein